MAREPVEQAGAVPATEWSEFANSESLARALARRVAAQLSSAIEDNGEAVLAVSGGSTPKLFFDHLADEKLDWSRVTVTLVDERFVPLSSNRSNAKLVTMRLLQKAAAKARFEGLYEPEPDVEKAAEVANRRLLQTIPPPFDVVVLGMGNDGHTASFFPDAKGLRRLLDTDEAPAVKPVHAPSAGEERLTWNLSALISARLLVLHIETLTKKDVFLQASEAGGETKLPIAIVAERAKQPVLIYWSPGKKPES